MAPFGIQSKLIAGFGFLLLLVLAVAAAGLLGLQRVQGFYQSAIEQGLEKERLAGEMKSALMDARRAEKDFMLSWRNAGFEAAYDKHIAENRRNLSRIRAIMAELWPQASARRTSPTDERILEDLLALRPYLDVYEQDFLALVDFVGDRGATGADSPEFRANLEARMEDVHAAAIVVNPLVEDIATSGKRYAAAEIQAARIASRRTALLVGTTFTTALLIGLGSALVLGRRIKAPLQALARAAGAVAAGDLGARAGVTSRDEIGTLAAIFDDMTARVRGLVASLEQRVAERKRAEEALRDSRELLQAIVDNSLAVIYVKDLQGRFLLSNRRFEHLFRLTKEAVLGKTDHELFPRELAERYRENDQRALLGSQPIEIEEQALLDDGYHHFIAIKAALRDAAGRAYAVCGISTDITQLKQVEEQLRQAQKMEAIGRLAGGIAHDFNNLLTVINGYSFMALRTLPAADPHYEPFLEIYKAGERAAGLTRQLLAYSRKQLLAPQVLSLDSIVGELEGMLRRLIGEHIKLVIELASEDVLVMVDRSQVEQIVLNLAINARDAMPDGGRLTLSTARTVLDEADAADHPEIAPGPHARLSVSDTGSGMTPEVLAHVFEPFFTTKAAGRGTGLGLSVVYGIVKQSGGTLVVESAPGEGSTFHIYFPQARRELEAAPSTKHDSESRRGSETVLLVEDDDAVRELACQALETKGYRVLPARNATEALAAFEQARDEVAIVVTDVVMPDMGGREVSERLRAIRPDLPVLYVSGYAEPAAEHPLAPGSADFLRKPFSPSELSRTVRRMLDRGPGSHPSSV